MKYELGMAAMALAARDVMKPGDKVPDEVIQQAVKEVTMHEVGHTLGLRHNFKASTMLKNDQLHDIDITRKQGLVGSVMDYSPANVAPKGVKQGDYFTTTLGPYDYWAIEYAYKPLSGGTDGELEKLQEIAKKCAQPGLDYATDEDLYAGNDPLVNQWDIGADPMKFAQDRISCWPRICSERACPTASSTTAKAISGRGRRSAFCWASSATERILFRVTSAASTCTAIIAAIRTAVIPFTPVRGRQAA